MSPGSRCPFCSGSGTIDHITLYSTKVNDYTTIKPNGTMKHRIRLELTQACVKQFLERHDNKHELLIIILDEVKNQP